MEIKDIKTISEKLYKDIEANGIDAIKKLFFKGTDLSQELRVNPLEEYIKKILISQMDIDRMLLLHKYMDTNFESIPKYRKESEKLHRQIDSNSDLKFDENTINALFGNSLNITSNDDYEEWKEFTYSSMHNGIRYDTIYLEEEFKYNYENEKKVIERQQQILTDYSGKEIGNRTIEEQFEKETGKRTITTNGELINEDGEYKFSETSEGIGTDLEKQRKEMIRDNKITGEKEKYVYQKDKNGNEMYYRIADGKLTLKITKNSKETIIENFDKGQITDVYEYDEEGKALIGIEGIENIDENYVENFFDSQVPYFEAENREILNNKPIVNTQKLGKETINEMSDTILMDETERNINQQVRNLYKTKESQEL